MYFPVLYWQRFNLITVNLKILFQDELKTLKERRVVAFQKCLTELAELELKHSKAHAQMLRAAVASLKAELWMKWTVLKCYIWPRLKIKHYLICFMFKLNIRKCDIILWRYVLMNIFIGKLWLNKLFIKYSNPVDISFAGNTVFFQISLEI